MGYQGVREVTGGQGDAMRLNKIISVQSGFWRVYRCKQIFERTYVEAPTTGMAQWPYDKNDEEK